MGSCIVYHENVDDHGNHVKFKTCIVAHGFSQVPMGLASGLPA